MKATLATILLASCLLAPGAAAEPHSLTLYIQFVKATEKGDPPSATAKPIGPKLGESLARVFRWNHYWEIRRHTVILAKDQTARIRMTPERTLELELADPKFLELRSIRKGKPTTRTRVSTADKLTVLGGDSNESDGWFFVVRRDKPSTD